MDGYGKGGGIHRRDVDDGTGLALPLRDEVDCNIQDAFDIDGDLGDFEGALGSTWIYSCFCADLVPP